MDFAALLIGLGIPEGDAKASPNAALFEMSGVRVFLEHEPEAELLSMLTVVGHWKGDSSTLHRIARANYSRILTKGATLSLRGDTKEIYLSMLENTQDVELSLIISWLEGFLEAALFWMRSLRVDEPSHLEKSIS